MIFFLLNIGSGGWRRGGGAGLFYFRKTHLCVMATGAELNYITVMWRARTPAVTNER